MAVGLGAIRAGEGNVTPERLRQFIADGETLQVEFKGEEKRPLSDQELVECVVCVANRPGNDFGWVLIGVEDDGRITGARSRHEAGKTDPLRVQALIANRTRPALTCRVYPTEAPGQAHPGRRGPFGHLADWDHGGQVRSKGHRGPGHAGMSSLPLPRDAGSSGRSGAPGPVCPGSARSNLGRSGSPGGRAVPAFHSRGSGPGRCDLARSARRGAGEGPGGR